MNKFKKVMLGALSVLTLGLFAVVGTRVNAATNENSYLYTTKDVATDSTVITTETEGMQLGNSIFTWIDTTGKTDFRNSITLDGIQYSSCIYIASGSSKGKRALKVEAPSAGKIKIMAWKNDSERTIKLYNSSFNEDSSNQSFTTVKTKTDAVFNYFDIDEAGTYYIYYNNSVGFYHLEFIDSEAEACTVTSLQQESTNLIDDTYRLVRFVFIVTGKDVDTNYLKNRFNLIVDVNSSDQVTANVAPIAVKRITHNGEDYSTTVANESYTFSSKDNVSYIVYVARFTESTFSGHSICASLYFGGTEYKTTKYTFA